MSRVYTVVATIRVEVLSPRMMDEVARLLEHAIENGGNSIVALLVDVKHMDISEGEPANER